MMEQKIELTLTNMGEILGGYFMPSHRRLYALNRLGVKVPKIHHRDRKKELTVDDRKRLIELLQDLNRYVEHYGVDDNKKYYVELWKKNLIEILNEQL